MKSSKVISNTGWILFGNGFNKVSSIILLFILSRYLGVEDFGRFSFAFFYMQFFYCIAEFGFTPVLIKYMSLGIVRPEEIQGKGIMAGLIMSALAVLLSWAGTYILGYQDDLRYLIVVASLGILISFRDITFRWILEVPFRAKLRMAYPVVLGIFSELFGLLMVFLTVYFEGSLESILAVYVLSSLPAFIWLSIISIREVKPVLTTHSISIKNIMQEAAPIGISNMLITAYLMFGSLVLFHFKGEGDLGYYALALRLITSLRIIPEAMMHSLFPFISRATTEGLQGVGDILKTAIKYGAFIAFPLAFGTMVVSDSVTVLLGGEQFGPAAAALSIMIWATFFAFFNTILRFTFNGASMQRYNFNTSILMLIISILLSLILIPRYGFIGASYALVAAECAGLIYGILIARPFLATFSVDSLAKNMLAALIMTATIWFIPSLPLQIVSGLVVYLIASILLKGISKDELLKLFPVRV